MARTRLVAVSGTSGYLGGVVASVLLAQQEVGVFSISRRTHPLLDGVAGFTERLLGDPQFDSDFLDLCPDVLIHCAAMTSPADCERTPDLAWAGNVALTERLVALSDRTSTHLVYVSTDLVFEGAAAPAAGFCEDDRPEPRSVYARSKAAAEEIVLKAGGAVVRVSLLTGPKLGARHSPLQWVVDGLSRGEKVELFFDEWRTPVFVCDVAQFLVLAAGAKCTGIFHFGGPERLSRLQMGQQIAGVLGVSKEGIVALRRAERPIQPPRPEDVSLNSAKALRRFALSRLKFSESWGAFEGLRLG